jgi:hypothetical protein
LAVAAGAAQAGEAEDRKFRPNVARQEMVQQRYGRVSDYLRPLSDGPGRFARVEHARQLLRSPRFERPKLARVRFARQPFWRSHRALAPPKIHRQRQVRPELVRPVYERPQFVPMPQKLREER